jgi:hypothetical protein
VLDEHPMNIQQVRILVIAITGKIWDKFQELHLILPGEL